MPGPSYLVSEDLPLRSGWSSITFTLPLSEVFADSRDLSKTIGITLTGRSFTQWRAPLVAS